MLVSLFQFLESYTVEVFVIALALYLAIAWLFIPELWDDIMSINTASYREEYLSADFRVIWVLPCIVGGGIMLVAFTLQQYFGIFFSGIWGEVLEIVVFIALFAIPTAWWVFRNFVPMEKEFENFRMWKLSKLATIVHAIPTVVGLFLLAVRYL